MEKTAFIYQLFIFYSIAAIYSVFSESENSNHLGNELTTTALTADAVGEERAVNYPCQCGGGECGCCSGNILSSFNVNVRNKACVNITYFPEDFEFHVRLTYNNNVFYQRRISGKNPPPLCASIPRLTALKMCLVFNNVYVISRNIHMCINMEGKFQENTLFSYNFDCIRVGANGVALLKPEEGGGLGPPAPVIDNITNEEDYDSVVASEGDEIQSGRSFAVLPLL